MIQQGINQTLGTIGIMGRLSPSYENKQTAGNIYKKGVAAQKGIEDIYTSVNRVKRSKSGEISKDSPEWRPDYSPAELRDTYGRLKEHVGNIGELKTAAIEGQPTAKFIPKDKEGRIKGLASRPEYSEMLTGLENDLQGMMAPAAAPAVKRSMANNRVVDKAVKAIQQDNAFKERRDAIMSKLDEPPMKPFDEASGKGIQQVETKREEAVQQKDDVEMLKATIKKV